MWYSHIVFTPAHLNDISDNALQLPASLVPLRPLLWWQRLNDTSLRIHYDCPIFSLLESGLERGKKVNICNELQLFLKQAQKRLIYLKYLKSLAWWFNYLWTPGHNLEWERLSRYWNEMQMFVFFLPFLCLDASVHLKIDYESAPSLSVTEREFKLCVRPLSCICLFKFKFSTLLSACLSAFSF